MLVQIGKVAFDPVRIVDVVFDTRTIMVIPGKGSAASERFDRVTLNNGDEFTFANGDSSLFREWWRGYEGKEAIGDKE